MFARRGTSCLPAGITRKHEAEKRNLKGAALLLRRVAVRARLTKQMKREVALVGVPLAVITLAHVGLIAAGIRSPLSVLVLAPIFEETFKLAMVLAILLVTSNSRPAHKDSLRAVRRLLVYGLLILPAFIGAAFGAYEAITVYPGQAYAVRLSRLIGHAALAMAAVAVYAWVWPRTRRLAARIWAALGVGAVLHGLSNVMAVTGMAVFYQIAYELLPLVMACILAARLVDQVGKSLLPEEVRRRFAHPFS